jgi:hypothetical protein
MAGLDADANVDAGSYTERLASASEPLRVWARSARPRLAEALADFDRIRSVALELERPGEAYALATDVMNAIGAYQSAVDALASDSDGGHELVIKAQRAWREMQARNGLVNYAGR